jgi:hypothetical protein
VRMCAYECISRFLCRLLQDEIHVCMHRRYVCMKVCMYVCMFHLAVCVRTLCSDPMHPPRMHACWYVCMYASLVCVCWDPMHPPLHACMYVCMYVCFTCPCVFEPHANFSNASFSADGSVYLSFSTSKPCIHVLAYTQIKVPHECVSVYTNKSTS